MFIVIRKNSIIVCLLIILFVGVSLFFNFKNKNSEEVPAFAIPTTNKVILIDAGHGGADAGASANGAVEKDINLEIALKLQEYIEQGGGVAILVRDKDVSTQPENKDAHVSFKKSDLIVRKNMATDYNADLFISIHVNKFEQSQYKGAQVFYANNSSESKELGDLLQSSLKEVLDRDNNRIAKNSNGNIYIIKNVSAPSALVECGFLSNEEEASALKSGDYQQKVAWAIYIGITKYLMNIN